MGICTIRTYAVVKTSSQNAPKAIFVPLKRQGFAPRWRSPHRAHFTLQALRRKNSTQSNTSKSTAPRAADCICCLLTWLEQWIGESNAIRKFSGRAAVVGVRIAVNPRSTRCLIARDANRTPANHAYFSFQD